MSSKAKPTEYQVIATTDGKYIGHIVWGTGEIFTDDGVVEIVVDNIQLIDDTVVRISNSNYIIEARKI